MHNYAVAPIINLTKSRTSSGYTLTCTALGYPRLTNVRWETLTDGTSIAGSNDIFCQAESSTFDFCLTSTLDIESNSCDQNGYRCSVTNAPITTSRSISVCVVGKCVCVCVCMCVCVCVWVCVGVHELVVHLCRVLCVHTY